MRLIIFLLALVSAFSFSAELELDLSDLAEPKKESTDFYQCDRDSTVKSTVLSDALNKCSQVYVTSTTGGLSYKTISESATYRRISITLDETYCIYDNTGKCIEEKNKKTSADVRVQQIRGQELTSCPPEDLEKYPEHVHMYTDEQGTEWCARELPKSCPAGYYPKSVSHMLGDKDKCHPRDCPDVGAEESLKAVAGFDDPFTSSGLYCNDGCAYTVNIDSQTSSPSQSYGTSTGAHCAPYIEPNKKLSDLDDTENCTNTLTDSGKPFINCDGVAPTPPPDESEIDPDSTVNNDESKVDPTKPPKEVKDSCSPDDLACNILNVEKEIANTSIDEISESKNLHNKMVDVETKNTNKLVEANRDIARMVSDGNDQQAFSHDELIAKLDELIAAQNGNPNGDGDQTGDPDGTDGGTGDGFGDCGDALPSGDCPEGTPVEECIFGSSEIPSMEIDVDELVSQYQNSFDINAELPTNHCMTIGGYEICYSYEHLINFFKAMSYLLVASALIHALNIIRESI